MDIDVFKSGGSVVRYFGYDDVVNPHWFELMCDNFKLILKLRYTRYNRWWGLCNRDRLNIAINHLKSRNRRIMRRNIVPFGQSCRFDRWVDGRGTSVMVLEIFYQAEGCNDK